MSNPTLPGDLKRPPDPMRLRDALRALPQVAPERSVWPELAAHLEARRRDDAVHSRGVGGADMPARPHSAMHTRRRYFVPAALAAAVLLAIAAGEKLRQPNVPAQSVATVAPGPASFNGNAANSANATSGEISNAARLDTLQRRSQALEHWLRETARAGGPLAGQDLAAATEIEDMIGLVDLQLGAEARDGEVALWQRRVALLEDLTALRYSSYSVAESGVAASTPANWTN